MTNSLAADSDGDAMTSVSAVPQAHRLAHPVGISLTLITFFIFVRLIFGGAPYLASRAWYALCLLIPFPLLALYVGFIRSQCVPIHLDWQTGMHLGLVLVYCQIDLAVGKWWVRRVKNKNGWSGNGGSGSGNNGNVNENNDANPSDSFGGINILLILAQNFHPFKSRTPMDMGAPALVRGIFELVGATLHEVFWNIFICQNFIDHRVFVRGGSFDILNLGMIGESGFLSRHEANTLTSSHTGFANHSEVINHSSADIHNTDANETNSVSVQMRILSRDNQNLHANGNSISSPDSESPLSLNVFLSILMVPILSCIVHGITSNFNQGYRCFPQFLWVALAYHASQSVLVPGLIHAMWYFTDGRLLGWLTLHETDAFHTKMFEENVNTNNNASTNSANTNSLQSPLNGNAADADDNDYELVAQGSPSKRRRVSLNGSGNGSSNSSSSGNTNTNSNNINNSNSPNTKGTPPADRFFFGGLLLIILFYGSLNWIIYSGILSDLNITSHTLYSTDPHMAVCPEFTSIFAQSHATITPESGGGGTTILLWQEPLIFTLCIFQFLMGTVTWRCVRAGMDVTQNDGDMSELGKERFGARVEAEALRAKTEIRDCCRERCGGGCLCCGLC